MKSDYLKILWLLRFEKMKKKEEEAAWCYQEIYDECLLAFDKKSRINEILHQLIIEERGHEKMAEELVRICRDSHPELGYPTI